MTRIKIVKGIYDENRKLSNYYRITQSNFIVKASHLECKVSHFYNMMN